MEVRSTILLAFDNVAYLHSPPLPFFLLFSPSSISAQVPSINTWLKPNTSICSPWTKCLSKLFLQHACYPVWHASFSTVWLFGPLCRLPNTWTHLSLTLGGPLRDSLHTLQCCLGPAPSPSPANNQIILRQASGLVSPRPWTWPPCSVHPCISFFTLNDHRHGSWFGSVMAILKSRGSVLCQVIQQRPLFQFPFRSDVFKIHIFALSLS